MIKIIASHRFVTLKILIAAALMCLTGRTPLTGQDTGEGVGPYRTQTIALNAGWNAVYLEVEPLESAPDALFDGTPIEIVASYFRPVTSMEYTESPSDFLGDRKSWSVWYAPERDDAILSNLYAIQAHHCYLIYSESAYTWNLEGSPYFDAVTWHPNAHNLVGFPVDTANAPTVANFFAGAEAQSGLKVYRMVNGRWVLITAPESTFMEAGKAYWTYAEGASVFTGPLQVEFKGSANGGIIYNESSGARRVVFTNQSAFPQELSLSLRAGRTGLVPMGYLLTALDGPDGSVQIVTLDFPETLEIGPLEAGQSFAIDLVVQNSEISEAVMGSTLVITSDAGLIREIPILTVRNDLLNQ
ncbi:hypothetical protein [Coraliomargarita parva]|uniref:hypothetical protein n=1 Tax=Coraliomargarita parva TaxID=3014050 RepID=UPI0022B4AB79|nr:hypothetical protein [Coraliomargarita parva]